MTIKLPYTLRNATLETEGENVFINGTISITYTDHVDMHAIHNLCKLCGWKFERRPNDILSITKRAQGTETVHIGDNLTVSLKFSSFGTPILSD